MMKRWNLWLAAAMIVATLPVAAIACDEHAAAAPAKDDKAVATKDAGCAGKGCCAKAKGAKAEGAKAPAAKAAAPAAKPEVAPAPAAAAATGSGH